MYSSFLKPYNPRRSQSDVSIESQSSNESGYGGSSPVFSRQNSNSTLTFNQETATVSFSTAQPPPSHSSPQPSLDSSSSSSHRSHPRDAANPESAGHSDGVSASSDHAHRRDAHPPHRHSTHDTSPAALSHRETPDTSETDSCSSHRHTQRYAHTDTRSCQRRNGDSGGQRRSAYSRQEYIEPEAETEPDSELDGHQVTVWHV